MLTAVSWLMLLACSTSEPDTPSTAGAADAPARATIRVGWQTTWATQGQLAMVLQKTDILDNLGFDAEFVGFTYGGPLNEGALAGEVDVLFTADQPAIALMNRAEDWNVVGRLMYNRVGTFVPPDSPVKAPAELKGRTVAVPFGAAAHRETLGALEAAGLDPSGDVTVVNLGIQELVALVGAGAEGGKWGAIDAGSAWDPAYANLERSGKVRSIASGVVTSVVVMDNDFVSAHPGADARFMEAMFIAYDYYRTHTDEVDQWFLESAKLDFEPGVLTLAASVEPNLGVGTRDDVRVWLNDEDLGSLQAAADFMLEAELLKAPFSLKGRVRRQAAEKVGAGTKVVVPKVVR